MSRLLLLYRHPFLSVLIDTKSIRVILFHVADFNHLSPGPALWGVLFFDCTISTLGCSEFDRDSIVE